MILREIQAGMPLLAFFFLFSLALLYEQLSGGDKGTIVVPFQHFQPACLAQTRLQQSNLTNTTWKKGGGTPASIRFSRFCWEEFALQADRMLTSPQRGLTIKADTLKIVRGILPRSPGFHLPAPVHN